MNRRGFLRGLAAVPVAAVVVTKLPSDEVLYPTKTVKMDYGLDSDAYVYMSHDGKDLKLKFHDSVSYMRQQWQEKVTRDLVERLDNQVARMLS